MKTAELSATMEAAIKHALVCTFLHEHHDLFESLNCEAMEAKMPDVAWKLLPHVSFDTYYGTDIEIRVHGPEQRDLMRTVRRAIGGTWNKSGYGDTFKLSREWGTVSREWGTFLEGVTINVTIAGNRQEICQKVVTGTKIVEHPPVEAQPARTEEVEEVEWVCGNLLDD